MFRNRFLILLGASFLAASAAWADDVGFVDCSSHSDGAQVFGKPRRTPEVLASLPCGERFTILVYGFVFSRIQTSDGKIGFVYSNLISVDRSGASVQQTSSPRMVSASEKVTVKAPPAPETAPAPAPQPRPQERAPVQSVSAQLATPAHPAQAQMPEPASSTRESSSSASNVPVATAATPQPEPPASAQPQPALIQPTLPQPAPASAPEAASSAAPSNVPEATPVPPQPDPPSAQPAAPAIRPKETRSTWEKRNPGGIRYTPLIEAFGGYAFARQDNGAGAGANGTNLHGGMGSVGWNFKPWLQVVADSSYNVVTVGNTKNVLYGNHFGPRYFHRGRNRWGATPFVEALVGGSRADTTISGVGGYATSTNCLSYKVGGGLDLRPSRHWEIRVFDIDYYRTAFGTNMHQNNYWASAGIVLRLFGGSSDY
jgi:hypothetical protein